MLAGVIVFSMFSSALTNYIEQNQRSSEKYEQKIIVLDRLQSEYKFPRILYLGIKKNIEFNNIEDLETLSQFIEDLPINLKTPLSICVYEKTYNSVDFLRSRSPLFISWFCPLLKSRVAAQDEIIYYEGDDLNGVYFIKSGECDYVLPKYAQTAYI